MSMPDLQERPTISLSSPPVRIGCVSFLNARPLVDGLETSTARASFQVPSRLLDGLVEQRVDIALLPVIDYFRSPVPLCVVPAGGISCDGPTLTVRLFSRVSPHRIRSILVDRDSHTSVVLVQILLAERYGVRPRVVDFDPPTGGTWDVIDADAVMLIGDKVVTAPPAPHAVRHELDLGQVWNEMTGLPFVFAVWMCRQGADLGETPKALTRLREANTSRIDELVRTHAVPRGWPPDLAHRYLTQFLEYEIGPRHLAAIERFASMAEKWGLIPGSDTLRVRK